MRALITGIGGQDGSYLAQYLLAQGYEVFGVHRRPSRGLSATAEYVLSAMANDGVHLIEGDATDCELPEVDEIYNLAAISHVGYSFKAPLAVMQNNTAICFRLLEWAKATDAKFYQASTSELFGASPPPQNELTPMHPRSPYGVSKLACYWAAINYREAYGLETYNGILFNHESPRRGDDFVTQKICRGIAAMAAGEQEHLTLGNLDAKRDWGHAKDFVQAMWLMMQHEPGEYVVATGEVHTVRDVLDVAFGLVGVNDWSPLVKVDPTLFRPAEVDHLCGDARKLRALGWAPKVSFEDMIREMLDMAMKEYGLALMEKRPHLEVVH